MKKVLVWETLSLISGGQKMTLTVMDLMKDTYSFHCLVPGIGPLTSELDKRNIPYTLMGDQTLPTGVKGPLDIFRYAWLTVKAVCKGISVIRREKPDLIYAPGPAALPWSALCGSMTGKPVIWHLHHLFLDGPTKKLLNLCSAWKSVRQIIAVSDCVKAQITNPKSQGKLETLYNPVDYEKYSSGDRHKVIHEFPFIPSGGAKSLLL